MIHGRAGCGMQYAVKKSNSTVAYCALSIKCGTRDEKGFHKGIAHFVEHTIFKGTEKRSATTVNGYLDRLGGELNAYTTKEEIVLHATVLKEDLGKAASLLFELATCPTFPENEINKEKGVVIDEIHSYKDSPSEDIYDKFEEMLFEGHPLSTPILGTVASVKRISREELLKFVHEKFIPEKMAFTIVADFQEEKLEKEILRLAEKFFGAGDTDGAAASGKQENCNFEKERECFDLSLNKRNHQVNCIIGGYAPSLYAPDKDRIATVLLCNILGGPANNSILNATLREKNGWVYGVECTYTQYADTGIVAISLGCDKENIDKCVKAIEKELQKLREVPFSERKLKAAKKQLLGQLAISSDNRESQCLSMGKSLLAFDRINSIKDDRNLVDMIDSCDIHRMANTIFDSGKLSKLIYY